jgi:SHS2 domain-containing protein
MYTDIPGKYFELEHTADVGIHADGNSTSEVFANAAFGMRHIMYGKIKVAEKMQKTIELTESTLPELMVRWLSELNFLLCVENYIFSSIENLSIKKQKTQFYLNAKLQGGDAQAYNKYHNIEIKAVTYHQLKFEKIKSGFFTEVIFDI